MSRVGRFIALLLLASVMGGEATAQSSSGDIDVRVVVDISGSMKSNDPGNLRQPAVRLLARLIPEGATAGVWTFGQYVNMLVPHGQVDDSWRQRAIERSGQINSVALRTNLGEALEVAGKSYYSGGSLDSTHFILLTDGQVDVSAQPAANAAERERVLGSVLAEIEQSGATVHTVALSDKADLTLLQTFADQTGGSYSFAENAEELNRVFLQALNAAIPQEQLPIKGNRFLVDSGVKEFTALIFPGEPTTASAEPLALIDPDGQRRTATRPGLDARWVHESSYDLVTLSNPQPGEWQLEGILGQGSRVTVVSDLRLMVSPLPPRFREGEVAELEAWFLERDERISNPEFLGVIEVLLTLTADDGRSGTKTLSSAQPPEDGVYRDQISRLPEFGDYQLELIADGQTFSRKFSQILTYVGPEGEAPQASAPIMAEAESEPEQPVDTAAETAEPQLTAVPDAGPIDLGALEHPEPTVSESAPQTTDWTAYLVVAGSVMALAVVGFGLWLWGSRRAKASQQASAEAGPSGEVEPTEQAAVAEVEVERQEAIEDEPEDDAVEVVEGGIDDPVAADMTEEADEEFGLEDFDLSEIESPDEPATEDEVPEKPDATAPDAPEISQEKQEVSR
ncbi:VWA domain-containing protein [Marinobacter sp. SS21]|uniref:VWA domain-containing protein n=1 Tax=Marinobacter sp. SS21 TaxID=2979460 RepID=UPI00232C3F9B|nr:VWA domain-containing protein [Marinobacter sp. SS21]MDC0661920.1 VWA domain-containing protein [Marinobacter sp. SS21]